MYYLIYKVTNKINGKYYLGKHKTKNPNDKYMGSGKMIKRAIKKYGIENFEKEILHYCESLEDMNNKEREVLTEEHVSNPNCYNQRIGGEGGWGHWLHSDEALESRRKGGSNSGILERNLALSKEEYQRRFTIGLSKWIEENGNKGNPLSADEKKLLSKKMTSSGNPMFNRVWVHKDGVVRTIEKKLLNEYESNGWNRGRRKRNVKSAAYGRIWINNGIISKLINPDDLDQYLVSGYSKGRITSHIKFNK